MTRKFRLQNASSIRRLRRKVVVARSSLASVGLGVERLEHRFLLTASGLGGISGLEQQLGDVSPIPLSTAEPTVVHGSIDPAQGESLYKISLQSNTSELRIDLEAPDGVQPLDDSVVVLDESGRKIAGARSLPGSTSLVIDLNLVRIHSLEGTSIYLKIAALNPPDVGAFPGGSLASPILGTGSDPSKTTNPSFLLALTPDPFKPTKPIVLSTPSIPQRSTDLFDSNPGGTSSKDVTQVALTTPSGATPSRGVIASGSAVFPGLVATGPLPNQTVFLPIIDQYNDLKSLIDRTIPRSVVDLALMDLPHHSALQGKAQNHEEISSAEEEENPVPNGPVVTLRGPGGFPLFGTSIEAPGFVGRTMNSFAQVRILRHAHVLTLPPRAREFPESRRSSRASARLAPTTVGLAPLLSGTISVFVALTSGLAFPTLLDQTRQGSTWRLRLVWFRLKSVLKAWR